MTLDRRVRPPKEPRLIAGMVTFVTVAMTIAGIVIWLLPATHNASAALTVRPRQDMTVSADVLRLVAHEYAVYLGSGSVAGKVAGDAGVQLDTVSDSTTVTVDPESTVIRVDVQTADTETAVGIANAVAAAGAERSDDDTAVVVRALTSATEESSTLGPPRKAYFALSAAAILLLTGSGAYLFASRSR